MMVTTICFLADPPRACREAWRVLKKGGRLVVGLIDRESPLGRAYKARRNENPFCRPARFFPVAEVVGLMTRA